MIPKIIHYCWFGRKPLPENVKKNIKVWQELNPDFTLKMWNEDNFDINALTFTREAYATKKYAFVSDVARLYALITEGGIYMDTDVTLVKGYEPFLKHSSFIGKEYPFKLSSAVIGAEKNLFWLNEFYDSYKTKPFINNKGVLNNLENTALLTAYYNRNYLRLNGAITIYEIDYFCAKDFPSKSYLITDNTVAIHEFHGTWKDESSSISQRLKYLSIKYFHSLISR
ncbi:MAG: glycosyltransferase family 32 protein [Phocaeicola sp.]